MNSKGAGVLKLVLALMAGAALGVGAHEITKDDSGTLIPASLEEQADAIINAAHAEYNTLYDSKFKPSGFAGSYLAGFFAQRHHDWTNANDYMQQSLAQDEKKSCPDKTRHHAGHWFRGIQRGLYSGP